MTAVKEIQSRKAPRRTRGRKTYDLLLNTAGQLLGEVGLEDISTNLVCARAGMSPPALYRYFHDKHDLLEALGRRLMDRQNAVLEAWLAEHHSDGVEGLLAGLPDLMLKTAEVTAQEPGAVWILRALHASPRLAHVRLESHRHVTDRLTDAYPELLPNGDREALWRRIRVAVEICFAVDEMLTEETRIPRDEAIHQAADLLRRATPA